MSAKSEAVKRWRRNTKKKLVEGFGGKCCICGYNKHIDALEFHHLNSKDKESGIAFMLRDPTKWIKIKKEVEKCVMVCSNCHSEVHGLISIIPKTALRFNDKLITDSTKNELKDFCPVCGKEKMAYRKTCSLMCAGKLAGKIEWNKRELEALVKDGKTNEEIATIKNCSGQAVIKRRKKWKI